MALRATFRQSEAGEELLQIESRTVSTVQEIGNIKLAALVLRTTVIAGTPDFFDATDLAEVDAVLVQLRADLQAATTAL